MALLYKDFLSLYGLQRGARVGQIRAFIFGELFTLKHHPCTRAVSLQCCKPALGKAQMFDHLVGAGECGGTNVTLVWLRGAQEHGLHLAAVITSCTQLHALPVHHGVGVGALVQAHVAGCLVGPTEALSTGAAFKGFSRVDVHVFSPVALLNELTPACGALVLPSLHFPVQVCTLKVVYISDV